MSEIPFFVNSALDDVHDQYAKRAIVTSTLFNRIVNPALMRGTLQLLAPGSGVLRIVRAPLAAFESAVVALARRLARSRVYPRHLRAWLNTFATTTTHAIDADDDLVRAAMRNVGECGDDALVLVFEFPCTTCRAAAINVSARTFCAECSIDSGVRNAARMFLAHRNVFGDQLREIDKLASPFRLVILFHDALDNRQCFACSAPAHAKCRTCGFARYCSLRCQTADWHRHRTQCARDARAASFLYDFVCAGHLEASKHTVMANN